MGLTQRWAAFLYTHPRIRRIWLTYCVMWSASIMSVAMAPRASAAIMADVLSWTGLHDSYGVPIGQHFVSLVPVLEAIREQAPTVTADPTTWPTAIGHWAGTWITYQQMGMVLDAEATMLCTLVAFTIWVVRFALSAAWLGWLVELARPLMAQMGAVANRAYLAPFAFLAVLAIGGLVARRDGYGRGFGIIAGGLGIIAIGWKLLGNDANDVLGEDGILGFARTAGFSVSQGVAHNGALSSGGTAGQLEVLSTRLVDVLVRHPIEQVTFSQVIDNIPGCGAAYSQGLLSGQAAAPAHAMATCDATGSALTAARMLDFTTVFAFAFVIGLISLICLSLNFVSIEAFAIGAQAFWNVLILPYAVIAAAPPGPTRDYGKSRVSTVFKLGVQYFFATLGVGVLVVMMYNASSPWVAQTINMTHPVAQLTAMMILALSGAIGFFCLVHSLGRRTVAGMAWAATGGRALSMIRGGKGQNKKSEIEQKRKNVDDLVEQRRRDNDARRNRPTDGETESDLPARRPLADVGTQQITVGSRPKITPAQAKTAADAAAAGGLAGTATALLERRTVRETVQDHPSRSTSGKGSSGATSLSDGPGKRSTKASGHSDTARDTQLQPWQRPLPDIESGQGTDPDDHPGRHSRPPSGS